MPKKAILAGSLAGAIVLLGALIYFVPPLHEGTRTLVTTAAAQLSPVPDTPFPKIDESTLSPDQVRILQLARDEYARHPVSYDQAVLTYTDGNKEAWCADFVSWIMKQTGHPYLNPNSGSWRIPGVYTLQEYYESGKRYSLPGIYQPQPGDVAFYIGRHTFDMFSTSHVALVISVDRNQMTTLGGNENGHLRLDTQEIKAGVNSLVGFGRLN